MNTYIFDLDGTLYDKTGLGKRLVLSSPFDALKMGRERKTRKAFAACDYGNADAYYKAFCEAAHFSKDWFFTRYMPLMVKALQKHYRAFPSAQPLFKQLDAEKIPYAIYSDYPLVKERLAAIGLEVNCPCYSTDDFGAQKPAPRPFLEIAAELGASPKETTVAGDRDDTDGEGARRAGMGFRQILADGDLRSFSSAVVSP
jgi:HAD superfamily hydrolase (TIGR01549 family)